jgi:uncharacterized protein
MQKTGMTFRSVILTLFVCLLPLVTTATVNAAEFQLADAAQRQDWATVRQMLTRHLDVNARQPDGASALAWTAHWDQVDVADLLIHAGADVNAANDLGVTPLALACENASEQVVRRLLQADARPNVASATGDVPLVIAARTGNVDVVKALLAHGAFVDATDPASKQTPLSRQSPLMWAISERHPGVTRILIEAGANINARSPGGFTPLLFAARVGDAESAKALLDAGADPNAAWGAPMMAAPGGGRPDGSTPLMVAIASGRSEVAVLLLQSGADPNAGVSAAYTALHAAVAKNLLDVVKALLAHGANPNARLGAAPPANIFGRGAGSGSDVMPNEQDTTRASNGVKPSRPAKAFSTRPTLPGATPFWLAAKYVDVPMLQALIDGGADPLMTTADGTTPLMVAAGLVQDQGPRRHRGDLFGGVFNTDWGEKDSLDTVKFLLAHGADVNATNLSNQTALQGAAYMGGNSVLRLLFAKGAKLDMQDAQGQTAFRVAEGHLNNAGQGLSSWPETMTLLQELGANTALGVDGRTMLRQYGNLSGSNSQ